MSQSFAIGAKSYLRWRVVEIVEPALKLYRVVGEWEGTVFPALVFADFNVNTCLTKMVVNGHYQV